MRNVKGKVCNSYRAYKMLYYAILDAIIMNMFLRHLNLEDIDQEIKIPFATMNKEEKLSWLYDVSNSIVEEWFFCGQSDIFIKCKDVVGDPEHPDNYWVSTLEDGRVKCHFCEKTYAYTGSLRSHEAKCHNVKIGMSKKTKKEKKKDELQNHIVMLFKLILLHKNLDTAVDMGDGERVVRSAKYELPIYNLTNKTKYLIGSVHLTSLTSGLLPADQSERLISNRFVNLQGGSNNNISLDEYLEMLNRDTKVTCSAHQTKESILQHSKEYPHLVNFVHHFDNITHLKGKKGFHHIPTYQADVQKITKDLMQENVLSYKTGRTMQCQDLIKDRNPFDSAYFGLRTMIHRHQPTVPYHRLRNTHI